MVIKVANKVIGCDHGRPTPGRGGGWCMNQTVGSFKWQKQLKKNIYTHGLEIGHVNEVSSKKRGKDVNSICRRYRNLPNLL